MIKVRSGGFTMSAHIHRKHNVPSSSKFQCGICHVVLLVIQTVDGQYCRRLVGNRLGCIQVSADFQTGCIPDGDLLNLGPAKI